MRSLFPSSAAALAIVAAVLGCRDGAESPIAPSAAPSLDLAQSSPLYRQVDRGSSHACAVAESDVAYCWGDNSQGQLGDGTTERRSTPVPVATELRFRHVSAGFDHSCGTTTNFEVYCWGSNFDGQLGDGTGYPGNVRRLYPTAVAGSQRFRHVRAGQHHTCALTRSDEAFCWGNNNLGQLGDNTTTNRPAPVRVLGGLRFNQLTGGDKHTCGVTTDNRAHCWGANYWGQLGDGTNLRRNRPVVVTGGLRLRQITAGDGFTCALTVQNLAYCWGYNNDGQLGNGTTSVGGRPRPGPVAGGRRFDHLSAGALHTCGATLADRAY
ncbi:MAG: hypothetical protein M3477_02725, partial [Gemmatimonadota bacterium]|nr:hypothetical protein [Gemmatimonadota bacterium]